MAAGAAPGALMAERWGWLTVAPTLALADVVRLLNTRMKGLEGALRAAATTPAMSALSALDATPGLVEQTGAAAFAKRALGVATPASVPTRADVDARCAALVHTHAGLPTIAIKTTDALNLGTAYVDVPELAFAVVANAHYAFHFVLIADADATTTGIDVAVNGPAAPVQVQYVQVYWTTATARTERNAAAYDANTANTGSGGTTRALFEVRGVLRTGAAAGTLAARIKREAVGSGPNVRAGSYGVLTRLG